MKPGWGTGVYTRIRFVRTANIELTGSRVKKSEKESMDRTENKGLRSHTSGWAAESEKKEDGILFYNRHYHNSTLTDNQAESVRYRKQQREKLFANRSREEMAPNKKVCGNYHSNEPR